MSNEYKDWCWDKAQEILFENNLIIEVFACTEWEDGYLILGQNVNNEKVMYFVWLDETTGWNYREE